jgi:hypothetical protein
MSWEPVTTFCKETAYLILFFGGWLIVSVVLLKSTELTTIALMAFMFLHLLAGMKAIAKNHANLRKKLEDRYEGRERQKADR